MLKFLRCDMIYRYIEYRLYAVLLNTCDHCEVISSLNSLISMSFQSMTNVRCSRYQVSCLLAAAAIAKAAPSGGLGLHEGVAILPSLVTAQVGSIVST